MIKSSGYSGDALILNDNDGDPKAGHPSTTTFANDKGPKARSWDLKGSPKHLYNHILVCFFTDY